MEDLRASLEFSLAWTIPFLRSYAIDHLDRIRSASYIPPAILLSIARRHGIPSWIRPAIEQLREFSLASMAHAEDDLTSMPLDVLMGLETYRVYARLRETLMNRRLHLALRGPDVYHLKDCKDHKACSNAWDNTWLTIVGRKLLHPDDLFRPTVNDVRRCAEALSPPDSMTLSCFTKVSSMLATSSGAWGYEKEAVDLAVDMLMVDELNLDFDCNSDDGMLLS